MALTPGLLEHYRRILTARCDELARDSSRAASQIGEQEELEHLDTADRAIAHTAKNELFQEVERDSGSFTQVDEALWRIQSGDYGTCAVCGKDIPQSRLDAVPWASLCIDDQEKADALNRAASAQGGAPSRVA